MDGWRVRMVLIIGSISETMMFKKVFGRGDDSVAVSGLQLMCYCCCCFSDMEKWEEGEVQERRRDHYEALELVIITKTHHTNRLRPHPLLAHKISLDTPTQHSPYSISIDEYETSSYSGWLFILFFFLFFKASKSVVSFRVENCLMTQYRVTLKAFFSTAQCSRLPL